MKAQVLGVFACLTAISLVATPTHAGSITVISTVAQASAQTTGDNCSMQNAFSATCSSAAANASASTVANVLGGHLGAFAASTGGFANGFAQITVDLAPSDMTDQDLLEIDLSLNGTFSNGGATASLLVDDGNSFSVPLVISCGTGQLQLHGVPCLPAGVQQVMIPLANVDDLTLTVLLQPALSSAPASADFLHSADFTIKLPTGAILVNNPGGTLFAAAVPEPNTGLLTGSALVLVLALYRRRILFASTHPRH